MFSPLKILHYCRVLAFRSLLQLTNTLDGVHITLLTIVNWIEDIWLCYMNILLLNIQVWKVLKQYCLAIDEV